MHFSSVLVVLFILFIAVALIGGNLSRMSDSNQGMYTVHDMTADTSYQCRLAYALNRGHTVCEAGGGVTIYLPADHLVKITKVNTK